MPDNAELNYANDNANNDAGLYTWDLSTDTLYADSAVAELFGLDSAETEIGLPIEIYFERVLREDKAALAEAISEAIKSGLPFQASYRTLRKDGRPMPISAFGKCFRDRENVPRLYSGIVFALPEGTVTEADLRWMCNAALERARRERRDDIAQLLQEALVTLEAPRQGRACALDATAG